MKKALQLAIAASLLLPSLAYAASFEVGTNITVGSDTVTLHSQTGLADEVVVGASSFTVTVSTSSSMTFRSATKKNMSVTGGSNARYDFACNDNDSTLTVSNPSYGDAITVTIAIGTSCAVSTESSGGGGTGGSGGPVSSGGGGGGGGSSSVSTASATTPATVTSRASGLSSTQIDAIISLLQSFGAEQSVIDNVRASLTGTASGSVASVSGGAFKVALRLGMTHSDVKRLQVILNSDADTQVSASGSGSKGNETDYFGAKTKTAVQKFQVKHGIAKAGEAGYGDVGPKTRAKLNALSGN